MNIFFIPDLQTLKQPFEVYDSIYWRLSSNFKNIIRDRQRCYNYILAEIHIISSENAWGRVPIVFSFEDQSRWPKRFIFYRVTLQWNNCRITLVIKIVYNERFLEYWSIAFFLMMFEVKDSMQNVEFHCNNSHIFRECYYMEIYAPLLLFSKCIANKYGHCSGI